MSVMTSFKRKRIEKWCEDVAQYLKNGTICTTVIGNVAEDVICGAAVVVKENNNNSCVAMDDSTDVNNRNGKNPATTATTTTGAVLNGNKPDPNLKRDSTNNENHHQSHNIYIHDNNNYTINSPKENNAPPTNVSSTTPIIYNNNNSNYIHNNNNNSFPVVKFAYSHYHEQRRKIDRLVQGLPVLTANGLSVLDRPSSRASTEDHAPVIIVNGEEPNHSNNTRSRGSSSMARREQYPGVKSARSPLTPTSPLPHTNPYINSAMNHNGTNIVNNSSATNNKHNNINNNNNKNSHSIHSHHLKNISNHLHPSPGNNYSHRSQNMPPSLRRNGSGGKLYDFRTSPRGHVGVTVDPGLALTANDRVERIKTAPVPNRNLHRARQRILTRRGNRVLEPSSQIPLQSCWAMAELTW